MSTHSTVVWWWYDSLWLVIQNLYGNIFQMCMLLAQMIFKPTRCNPLEPWNLSYQLQVYYLLIIIKWQMVFWISYTWYYNRNQNFLISFSLLVSKGSIYLVNTHLIACCSIWRWSFPVLANFCSMVAFHWRKSALKSRIAWAYPTCQTISVFLGLPCPLVHPFPRPHWLLLWNTLNVSWTASQLQILVLVLHLLFPVFLTFNDLVPHWLSTNIEAPL